jgi:hypothetical protein
MLRPEFYPHRPAEVRLVQTHISYVFLAGAHVYKIKKPVRFSFLDFATVARRRHFCHEEVRLNRRLAPDVYFGVVAVCRSGDEYWLGEEDNPAAVEYAVHMRRLPEDRILARLLDRDEVTPELIDTIARRLAEFHRDADAGSEVTANGDPQAIAAVMEDDFAEERPFRGGTISASDDDAVQQFCRSFLMRNDALFRTRQAEHRIRDGHGDLHAEHVCCTDKLIIFDCIEFNVTFRHRDVAADIAFLAMDLEYHGHPELAAHLVARYAAYAGDPGLCRLVPFYACYRAYVRGKVDSLKSTEPEVAPADREAAQRSASRHFALAYRYTWAYNPCLVVIAGLSGTGKSAIAAALQVRTGFVHLNSDVIRKQLDTTPPHADGYETGRYAPEITARTYGTMFARTDEHLAGGRGVILDATFQRRADRDAVRALAATRRVPFLVVECRCREDEVRRRLRQRAGDGATASEADWTVYAEQRRRYEQFGADEQRDRVVVDTAAAAPIEVAGRIEAALRGRSGL